MARTVAGEVRGADKIEFWPFEVWFSTCGSAIFTCPSQCVQAEFAKTIGGDEDREPVFIHEVLTALLCHAAMSLFNYTVDIPDTAVIVDN
jgi:hypothetical protein